MDGNRLGVTGVLGRMKVKRLYEVTSKWQLAEKATGTKKKPSEMATSRIPTENSVKMMG